jgi:transcriptional regulator with XRE-family HTH domain
VQRHPSEMTPAELRCLREELRLTVKALSAAIGQTYQTVTRWESGERVPSRYSSAALADLVTLTDSTVAALVAAHEPGATIVTYLDDASFQEHVDTGVFVLPASWHRGVAWRAAAQIPGATIAYQE